MKTTLMLAAAALALTACNSAGEAGDTVDESAVAAPGESAGDFEHEDEGWSEETSARMAVAEFLSALEFDSDPPPSFDPGVMTDVIWGDGAPVTLTGSEVGEATMADGVATMPFSVTFTEGDNPDGAPITLTGTIRIRREGDVPEIDDLPFFRFVDAEVDIR
jgi:hypothetical protein